MIRSRAFWRFYSLGMMCLIASCGQPLIETKTSWEPPPRDEALIRQMTQPILIGQVEAPLHW